MADFTKSISNAVALFGAEKTSNWGDMLWGENWAYGSRDLIVSVEKTISEAVTLDNTIATAFSILVELSEIMTVVADMYSEELVDRNGYKYIFGETANAESRPFTSYTKLSNTTSFTTASATSTSWTVL